MEIIMEYIGHIVAEIVVVGLIAIATFFLGRYYVTPKRCQNQKEECRKMIKEEFQKISDQRDKCTNEFELEADRITKDLSKHRTYSEEKFLKKEDDIAKQVDVYKILSNYSEKMENTYVRRDVVLPRLEDIHDELSALRNIIYKYVKVNGGK